jgi:hypothetical protein
MREAHEKIKEREDERIRHQGLGEAYDRQRQYLEQSSQKQNIRQQGYIH